MTRLEEPWRDRPGGGLRGRLSPFLALFCFYMLTTSRERPWSDGTPIFEVAEAIVERHSVAIPTRWPANLAPGRGGHTYALSPLLPSLVHVPGALVKRVLNRIAPDKGLLWRAWTSHLGPSAVAALTTLLLVGFCTERFGRRAALVVGAAAAFATTLCVYARYPYSELLQALCFTGLFLELLRVVEQPTRRHALWVGAWAALLIDAKLANAPVVPGIAAWILWGLRGQWKTAARVLGWAAAIGVPLLALIPLYNWARWGSFLDTGFGVSASLKGSENATVGLWGMFFSPNKSVFLYSPALLLAVVALPRTWRTWRRYFLLLALVALPPLLVHARLVFWSGDWAWGPRYIVFLVPVMLLPAALLFTPREAALPRTPWEQRARVAGVAAVIAFGVFVQFLGCSFMWDHFIRETLAVNRLWLGARTCTGFCYEELHAFQWSPPFTQLWGHWWLLKHVPRGHTWKQAQVDAPWRRYTDQEITLAEPYNRARSDWWWLDYGKGNRALGAGLATLLGLGLAASTVVFVRQERARLRAEVPA